MVSVTVVDTGVPCESVAVMVMRYSPGVPVLVPCEAPAGATPVISPLAGSICSHDGRPGSSVNSNGLPSGSTTTSPTRIGVSAWPSVALTSGMMLSGSAAGIGLAGVPGLAGSITTGASLTPSMVMISSAVVTPPLPSERV